MGYLFTEGLSAVVIFHKLLALNKAKVSVSCKLGTTENYKPTFTFRGKLHTNFVLQNLCLIFFSGVEKPQNQAHYSTSISKDSANVVPGSVKSFADFQKSKGKEWKERVSKKNKGAKGKNVDKREQIVRKKLSYSSAWWSGMKIVSVLNENMVNA